MRYDKVTDSFHVIQVDENMHRAHRRDAVNTQKFFFRKDLYSPQPGHACKPSAPSPVVPIIDLSSINGNHTTTNGNRPISPEPSCESHSNSRSHSPSSSIPPVPHPEFGPVEEEYGEFTINEIMNGDGKEFPGLMGVVRKYLDSLDIAESMRKELEKSLGLISRRADG